MSWRDQITLSEHCRERVLTQEKLPALRKLDIITGGIIDTADHYRVARISPEAHVLLFSVAGQGQLHTPQFKANLGQQAFALLPAGQPFEFSLNSAHWSLAWLLLQPGNRWPVQLHQARIENTLLADTAYHLQSIIYNQSLTNDHASHTQLDHLDNILHQLITPSKVSPKAALIQSVFQQVAQQLHRHWQVADMANLACVSEAHFYRLCQQQLGLSPKQKLIALRMERARHFLKHSDWLIGDIAQRLGYVDPLNFSHAFKRYQGISPNNYRNQKHQESVSTHT